MVGVGVQLGRRRRAPVLLEVVAGLDDFPGELVDHRPVEVWPDHDPQRAATGLRFTDCQQINLAGLLVEDLAAGSEPLDDASLPRQALLELVRCRSVNVSGTQLLGGVPYGLFAEDCVDTLIHGCSILDSRTPKHMQVAVQWTGAGRGNAITASRIGSGSQAAVRAPAEVAQQGNHFDD